jgi:hypothetical protein
MVDLSQDAGGDCTYTFEAFQVNILGRAKCNAIEGFRRALHGVQDFYSHSNWVDHEDRNRPVGIGNPPGLGIMTDPLFLDLRASNNISDEISLNLTTGCYKLVGSCADHVTHQILNKDHGIINLDGPIGAVGPNTPRSDVGSNFALAVASAVRDSRR